MRSKLDQALSVISRLQKRLRSWMDTTRNLTLLASENAEAVAERDRMASQPLGFVHGVIGRVAQELGPEASVSMVVSSDRLVCKVRTPGGSLDMTFNEADYNQNADLLALSIRRCCEDRRVLPRAKEV